MKQDPNCIFCKLIAKEIPCNKIYEDSEYFAFLDISPNSKGHTLLIPKDHQQWWLDLEDKDVAKASLPPNSYPRP